MEESLSASPSKTGLLLASCDTNVARCLAQTCVIGSSFPSRTLVENVGVPISLDLESDVTDMSVPILPYWVRTTNM